MDLDLGTITLDVVGDDLDRAFAAWHAKNRERTKAAVVTGFVAIAQGVEAPRPAARAPSAAAIDEVRRAAEYAKDVQLEGVRDALDASERRRRELHAELDEVRREHEAAVRGMHEVFLEQVRALEAAFRGAAACVRDPDAERLRGQVELLQAAVDDREPLHRRIRDLEREVELMGKTNAARGNLGEGVVREHLAAAFPDATIADVSGTPHSCDVHLAMADGRRVAFEVKHKGAVVRADVDKFRADVERLARTTPDGAFAGAVLVSLASRNVPGKGDMHLEMVAGVPVAYVGLADAAQQGGLAAVTHATRLLLCVHAACASMERGAAQAADVVAQVARRLAHVRRLRQQAAKARDAALAALDLADAMRREADAALEGFEAVAAGDAAPAFACPACGLECKTRVGLAKHVAARHPRQGHAGDPAAGVQT